MAQTLIKNIRNARKMFKLHKCMDSARSFHKGLRDFSSKRLGSAFKSLITRQKLSEHTVTFQNLFYLISKFASTLFYMLDNTNLLLMAIFGPHHPHRRII